MTSFFIAGTDIGVGKTYVAQLLLKDLKRRGISAGAYKPVCCGDRAEVRLLREAASMKESLEIINPVYLRTWADPQVAAELERKFLTAEPLLTAYQHIAQTYEWVLTEGIGGWETPLATDFSMADLAQQLQLPVLLVVRNQRGAASLAKMHIQAILKRGLLCRGIILNHIGEEWSTASVTNRRLIEQYTGTPVLAELIHGEENLDSEAILGC